MQADLFLQYHPSIASDYYSPDAVEDYTTQFNETFAFIFRRLHRVVLSRDN